ncbi:MAG: aromatic-ring-hydroxylating dioxygenase subunit beta [Burkholderiaceae bacterium]
MSSARLDLAPGVSLRAALRDLYDDYFACLEDQDIDRWPSYFTDDGHYLVQSAENHSLGLPIGEIFCDSAAMMRDRSKALQATSVYESRRLRYFPGVLRVGQAMQDGAIPVELGYMAVESIVGDPPVLFSAGRSYDVVVQTGNGLRFRKRTVVYDHTWILNSLVFPL